MLRSRFHFSLTRNMSVFTQCLNPITGTTTWEKKHEDYDYHQEVARAAFADMLHDSERNKKYYTAIKLAINKMHQAGKEANVLDIGTGTGLLSMMAAKCGADSVTACESFTPMAKCALKVIEENGFAEKIKLVQKHSTKMTVGPDGDMPKRANILVAEVFDTELIGEGAISTFSHAHEALLEKHCIVVPDNGTIWVQVVESLAASTWNRIKPIKNGKDILVDVPDPVKSCSGAAAVHDVQLSRFPYTGFKPLLQPQPIFKFDWSGKQPLKYDEKAQLKVKPIANGTAHAIFMWWDLNMDTENKVLLSCAPAWEHPEGKKLRKTGLNYEQIADSIPWRDHWMQAIYYFPKERTVSINEEVSLLGYHDEYSLWFQLINEPIEEIPDCQRPVCDCHVHVAFSRTRIGQLNNERRNTIYLQALKKKVTPDTVGLCLSDGCLLGLAMIKLGAKKVYMLESNFLSRKTMDTFIQKNSLSERVQIVESTDYLPPNEEINLIFGEPYFLSSIVPWENLRFWYHASNYSSETDRIPIAATIKGVAVEFKDLYKIRAPLKTCEGFDLSSFDKLIQTSSEKSDNPIEAQPLWEYPARALSAPFVIAKFDFTKNVNECERMALSGTIPMLKSGTCNGVALWVDWHLDSELSISTGPIQDVVPGKRISWDPFTRQGVHLFRCISHVTHQNVLSWTFTFALQHGDMEFTFKITQNH